MDSWELLVEFLGGLQGTPGGPLMDSQQDSWGQVPKDSLEFPLFLMENTQRLLPKVVLGFPRNPWESLGILLLTPDLLHQVIKGGFKDHLVMWVCEYLKLEHGATEADRILDDIDYWISLTPSFPGLRRFPQGQGFKQWTGDDSKALMKVYIPAIEGHVPQDMVRTLTAYLDFCYLVWHAKLNTSDLNMVDEALSRFHHYRKIFQTTGV
ncbi:hypothetical protein BD779DRAFT_1680333 [Infundibulicybe gibba]|nr:hypothetical protein BD779DRAFT_1680333 [Infundibulicybe gibba]